MATTPRHRIHDVIVVGGRCAGAATAMLLAGRGHDVVVVDRAAFPSDTLSTHAIARTGVVQLARWGLLDELLAAGTPAIRLTAFHSGDDHVTRPIKDRASVDLLVAPRRHVLDQIVAGAAVRAGAELQTGVTVRGVHLDDDGRVTGIHGDRDGQSFDLHARFVVGADGLRSRIARSVDAPLTETRPSSASTHYAYYTGIDWPATEYFLGDRALAGIFPTNGGEACIWICTPADVAERTRRDHSGLEPAFEALLAEGAPDLVDRLAGTRRTSPVRGVLRLPNQLRQPYGPGWALVGDAGYHRDPITGQGISDAFIHAELLADGLDQALRHVVDERSALASYHARRDGALREIFDITCALAEFPPRATFMELQKQLAQAIDAAAVALAAPPLPCLAARAA